MDRRFSKRLVTASFQIIPTTTTMSKSNEESLRENLLSETIVLGELPILGETHIEERWLKACLPVIIQPALDVKNGNELVKLMYEFIRDDRINRLNCRVIGTKNTCIILYL